VAWAARRLLRGVVGLVREDACLSLAAARAFLAAELLAARPLGRRTAFAHRLEPIKQELPGQEPIQSLLPGGLTLDLELGRSMQ